MSETIRIDAFQTSLHGAKILCQGPFRTNHFPPIMDAVQELRAPFKKKVLLTRSAFSLSKTLALTYDAIFQINEAYDWPLALTYIVHAPKPLLVVIEDVNIPDGVWPKFTSSMTVVHVVSAAIHNTRPYDTIFFAPIEDTMSGYADFVFRQIQALYRSGYSQKEFKEILQELRVAAAGITWTKYTESSHTGSLYWYDPVAVQSSDTLSRRQLSDLFSWLSAQFAAE